MTEVMHWIEDNTTRRKFWAYAKSDLGLTEDEVHQALGIESTKDFTGDKVAAMTLLQNYAAGIVPRRARDALAAQEQEHAEARVIAFCDLYTPGGTRVSLTAREGARHDDLVATTLALVDATKTLVNIFGFTQYRTPGTSEPMRKQPAKTKKQPPAPTRPAPPPAPGYPTYTNAPIPSPPGSAAPPPPPPPSQSSAPPAGNGQAQGGIIQTETVKITAPKGKSVVEFWRPKRKYREIPWSRGGEKLMAIAPTLAAAGWGAAHFDAIGEEYQLPVNVHWTPSKPDGKYKDITLVELR